MIFHAKLMQKHISPAGTALPANIFKNLTMHIHSQHPYLLGFDSNLIPNPHILVFQPHPGEDSKHSEKSGRFACNSASSLGNTPNNRENRLDWAYFPEGYSRVYYKYRVHRVFALF